MAPADIGLGLLELGLLDHPLAHFQLEQARFEHRHAFGAIAVLGAVVLALHHDAARQVGDPHRRFGLVHVLTAGA